MSRADIPGADAIVWLYDHWLKRGEPRPHAVVVEVGVALGKSVSYIADALILKHRRDVAVYAVDPWAGEGRNADQQRIASAGWRLSEVRESGDFTWYTRAMLAHAPEAFELVRPIRMPSVQASGAFADGSVDLVVIDGMHDEASVFADLMAWTPKLRPDGMIGGDDHDQTSFPGVVAACRRAFTRYMVTHEAGWPLWYVDLARHP